MKKIVFLLVVFTMLLLAVGCGGSSIISEPETETEQGIALGMSLKKSPTGFDFNLFRRAAEGDSGENVVLSTLSAKLALAMAYNGASGDTRDAMAKVLGFEGLSIEEVNRELHDQMVSLESADPKLQVEIANSLWTFVDVNFYEDFINRCKQYYDAEAANLASQDPSTIVDIINNWANEKTHGKIDRIIDNLDDDIYALMNAVYFNGKWTQSFDQSLTVDGDFHLSDESVYKVPMMHQSSEYPYYENEDFQAVGLPYGDGHMSMYVFLPRQGSDIESFVKSLSEENWTAWMDSFQNKEGAITLPRFKVEYGKELNDVLINMGMGIAFDDYGANFSEMASGGEDLFISRVLQKTYIDVNEEGTEAAAVTYIGMGVTSVRPDQTFVMNVDRPFFFAIRDNTTGTLLFMGSIANP
jgi:serine protease inhibitor